MGQFYLIIALCAVGSYVFGASPFGYWVSKARGFDIRKHGSGNIGATNVFRVVGKKTGFLVLGLDVLKGFVPVWIGGQIIAAYTPEGLGNAEQWRSGASVLLALATIIGHNYTFWLGFKGGKGIATSAGVMLAFLPFVFLGSLITWLLVLFGSGYVALASIAAAIAIIPLTMIEGLIWTPIKVPVIIFGIFASIMAIWRHRSNIERLIRGEEDKLGQKAKPTEEPEGTQS